MWTKRDLITFFALRSLAIFSLLFQPALPDDVCFHDVENSTALIESGHHLRFVMQEVTGYFKSQDVEQFFGF